MSESKRPGGIPFKSKLRPYVDQIRKWRRAGFTWSGIAEKLGQQGCKTYATNLCQFMRRYRRRPFASEAGPEPSKPLPLTMKSRSKHAPLNSKSSSPVDFERIVDEAQETVRAIESRPIFGVVSATRPL